MIWDGAVLGHPSKYSPEFRRDAVALVPQRGRIAPSFDRTRARGERRDDAPVGGARRKASNQQAAGLGEDELAELKRLRRENAELEIKG